MCKINGKKLGEIRTERGLSQNALARKTGLTSAAISSYECGRSNPTDENLERICMILKINKGEVEIQDIGYDFLSGISKTVDNIRRKKGFIRSYTPQETEELISSKRTVSLDIEKKEIESAMQGSMTCCGKKYIQINPTFIHIPEWQRNTDMAKVAEISENFSEDKFDPIKVYKMENGLLGVADGAHRDVAYVKMEKYKILAEVLECNEYEAIQTFLEQSAGRKPMSVCDTYRAGVKANKKEYIQFKDLFEDRDIQIVPETNKIENPIGKVVPSRNLLRMANTDRNTLVRSIALIKRLNWCGSTEYNVFTERNFKVLKKLYANYGENVEKLLKEHCSGVVFYESKVAPIKSNAELYDMLSAEISKENNKESSK